MPKPKTTKKKKRKNAVAQALVAMRNKKLTPERRREIARQAAVKRWADQRAKAETAGAKGKVA